MQPLTISDSGHPTKPWTVIVTNDGKLIAAIDIMVYPTSAPNSLSTTSPKRPSPPATTSKRLTAKELSAIVPNHSSGQLRLLPMPPTIPPSTSMYAFVDA
jgi:hypothetical protein